MDDTNPVAEAPYLFTPAPERPQTEHMQGQSAAWPVRLRSKSWHNASVAKGDPSAVAEAQDR